MTRPFTRLHFISLLAAISLPLGMYAGIYIATDKARTECARSKA